MRKYCIFLLGVIFIFSPGCISVSAQEEILPSADEIPRIEKRGKEIAEYERAAMSATDKLWDLGVEEGKLEVYIAEKTSGRWNVYFGRFSNEQPDFEVNYFFSAPVDDPEAMEKYTTPLISNEIRMRAAAVKTALKSIEPEAKATRYNTDVFREDDGTISVYLIPGNTNPDVVVLGGDFRVIVSHDGTKTLDKIVLHKGILDMPAQNKTGKTGGFHTHILGDNATETDIAFVLLNPQFAPHLILGREWVSQIDKNGKVTVLGRTKEILLN